MHAAERPARVQGSWARGSWVGEGGEGERTHSAAAGGRPSAWSGRGGGGRVGVVALLGRSLCVQSSPPTRRYQVWFTAREDIPLFGAHGVAVPRNVLDASAVDGAIARAVETRRPAQSHPHAAHARTRRRTWYARALSPHAKTFIFRLLLSHTCRHSHTEPRCARQCHAGCYLTACAVTRRWMSTRPVRRRPFALHSQPARELPQLVMRVAV
jgi:hypothetical protein